MIRVFTLAVGVGVGVVAGASMTRRVDKAKRAVAPTAIAERLGRRTSDAMARLRAASEAGRSTATALEAELRTTYGVPRVTETFRR